MHFTRLRVSGFKSFSDPIELLIERGLTGIVGPNGCGKSNIVEALRWVMGESSARGLRGAEMDDVIFNGAASRPAHDIADVRLRLFGRPNGAEGLEEIEIARRLARQIGSTFKINGREARSRDVQLLFADAGAGARSPAIIGQGQIGFIVDAKPQERRRLLEEAAGIGGLQTRRREAELRLEATSANLRRVLDLLATQEERLDALRKQTRDALRYRKLAAELRRTEAMLLLGRHHAAVMAARIAETAAQGAAAAVAERERALELAARHRARLDAALPEVRERVARLTAEAARQAERLEAQHRARQRAAEHAASLDRQVRSATEDLAREAALRVELAARVDTLAGSAARQADELARHADRLPALEVEARARARDLATAEAGLDGAVAALFEARSCVEAETRLAQDLQRRLALAERSAAELTAELAEDDPRERRSMLHASALERLGGELALAEQELAARAEAVAAAESNARAAGLARAEHTARLAEHENALASARAMGRQLDERRRSLERSVSRIEQRRAAQARQAEHVRVAIASLDTAAAEAASAAADAVLQAADRGLDAAGADLRRADAAAGEAQSRVAATRRAVDTLEAELRVLTSLAGADQDDGLLDELGVPPELATAFAAALGDDLLAGTDEKSAAHWRLLDDQGESSVASLPVGARPLVEWAASPPVLRRRLSQVGLIDDASAAALQPLLRPGQRLVSAAGGLWRWDGLVRLPGAEDPAAARLRHRVRLRAARAELAEQATALAEAEDEAETAHVALTTARAALAEAEAAWRHADGAQLEARREAQRDRDRSDQLQEELTRLDAEEGALAHDATELAAERAVIEAAESDLGDLTALAEAIETLRVTSRSADAEAQTTQAILAAREIERAAAARRHDELRRALEAERLAYDRCRETEAAAAEAAASRAVRRAALDGDIGRLRHDLGHALEARDAATAALVGCEELRGQHVVVVEQARAKHGEASEALAAAQAAARDTEHALAALSAERVQLAAQQAASMEREALLATRLEQARAEASALAPEADGADDLDALAQARAATDDALASAQAALAAAEAEAADAAAACAAIETELAGARTGHAVAQAETARAHAALEAASAVVVERLGEPAAAAPDSELLATAAEADLPALEERLARLRASRERIGPVNLRAEAEVAELEAAIDATRGEAAELQEAIGRLQRGIGELNREGRERLGIAFARVDDNFRALFTRLFGGGRAHLRLTDGGDPLSAGLELEACPPGKKLTSISLLSGGEKTLTAIALVFAFFLHQSSPLCVLDEVDAPLDDANVDRFLSLMDEIAASTGTRFLVVTHHPLTMARMDRLYGVTMNERGISHLVSVALADALELRATA